jgi:hypothetical protein
MPGCGAWPWVNEIFLLRHRISPIYFVPSLFPRFPEEEMARPASNLSSGGSQVANSKDRKEEPH